MSALAIAGALYALVAVGVLVLCWRIGNPDGPIAWAAAVILAIAWPPFALLAMLLIRKRRRASFRGRSQ